ncbi:MAG: carbohydrate kinase [Chromatiales bacterium]|jgi:fructokinase
MTMPDAIRPVIFGEVLFDRFPDGSRVLGGAPFNVAWNLQAFGLDPLFVSRVGQDPYGRDIRDAMEHWGMDTSGLQLDSAHPTGAVQVSIEDDEPSYDILTDQAYDHIDGDSLPPAHGSLLYHGTLALRGPDSRTALERCKSQYGAPVFVDVNLREPWCTRDSALRALDGARWAKLNGGELATLVPDMDDFDARMDSLQNRFGLETLFVTRGSEGAMARDARGGTVQVRPSHRLKVVDTVGAGDAFASVLILGLTLGWDPEDTLDHAQEFASAVVGLRGATSRDSTFYEPFTRIWGIR